jgi:signal peptidase I
MKLSPKVQWTLAIGLIASLAVVKFFVMDYYNIPQNGMYPAIPRDSTVWVNKLAYSQAADVKRGDIVIYEHRENGQTYNYIWRVVGLPGERVQTTADELIINGKPVSHVAVRTEGQSEIYQEQHPDCQFEICIEPKDKLPPETDQTLGSDEFFLLGDNRHSAADNRYKGPVKFSAFIGKKF